MPEPKAKAKPAPKPAAKPRAKAKAKAKPLRVTSVATLPTESTELRRPSTAHRLQRQLLNRTATFQGMQALIAQRRAADLLEQQIARRARSDPDPPPWSVALHGNPLGPMPGTAMTGVPVTPAP